MDNRHTTGATGAMPGSSGPSAGSDKLRSAMDEAKRSADQVASDVKDAASDLAGQARAAASEAADRTKHKVTDYAEQQKGAAADQIGKLSEAAHAAADHLNEASPTMARYAHDLAGGIDRFAGVVRERSVADLMRQASEYARREPAVFVAGTVFAGFVMARFLKSSAERAEREQWQNRGMGSSGDRYRDRSGFSGDRGRNASTGPGSMPGQAGSGRSYDPYRRYDERDAPVGGRSGAAGVSGSGMTGSSGLAGQGGMTGRQGAGTSAGAGMGSGSGAGMGSGLASGSQSAGQAGSSAWPLKRVARATRQLFSKVRPNSKSRALSVTDAVLQWSPPSSLRLCHTAAIPASWALDRYSAIS